MSRITQMSVQEPGAYPPELLDHYRQLAGSARALAVVAIRTRSLAARRILARAASADRSLEELIAAARNRDTSRLDRGSVWGLVSLARVIALQNVLPEDTSDGLALFDLALERYGGKAIPGFHQGLHAQLALRAGDHRRTATLLDTYRDLSKSIRSYLEVDLLNPFGDGGSDPGRWLSRFRRLLPEPAPQLAGEAAVPFDRLTATDRHTGGEPISVIVTSFKPGPGLATAIRSLLEQSWTDLEILIVDDGSPADYDPVLKACLELDPRVKLLKQAANAGTYAARNAGLSAASSTFVTFQDSDDWSHPRRLEHQIAPLLADPSLMATVSDGLRVRDDLIVTHTPGRNPYAVVPSSLMLRKDAVLDRIGYFDTVRREADSEYLKRLRTVFGLDAIHQLTANYSLIRTTPNSLSRTDIRAGWTHPVRLAYKSAYHLWHQQIREGVASPRLPAAPAHRPFVAPAYIRGATPPKRHVDIVVAGDWRRADGLLHSALDEIGALLRHGLRVGVLHIESFRVMPERHVPLHRRMQELINTGKVVQAFLSEELDTDLVLVQCPSVLQFAAGEPSRISAKRVVIRASRAPSGIDGADHRYLPSDCARTASQIFSVDPLWCPQGATIRARLEAELAPSELVPFDLPGVIDPARWQTDRERFRHRLPVLGKHFTDSWGALPADRETLLQVYPASAEADVRFLGGTGPLTTLLGTDRLPANWLAYDADQVSARSFLNQVDFYLHFPPPAAADAFSRAVLEALAAGCVVVLPHRLSDMFGDAALYCEPHEAWPTVRRHCSQRALNLDQIRRAREWVRQRYGTDAYLKLVAGLIG